MRQLLPFLFLSLGPIQANEALDVLEGNKKASEIELPPAPADSIVSQQQERGSVVYIQPHWAPSPMDQLWARAMLFEDPTNPWVQQVAITGFFDWHAAYGRARIDTPGGGSAATVDLDGTRTRRARLGARMRMFRNTDVEAVTEIAGSNEFRGIDRLSAETQILPHTKVKIGKFRPHFPREHGGEQEISAYPNHTMLANMISPRSNLGVMLSKNSPYWEYGLGWFSSDNDPDFPTIEGDGFLAFSLQRTLAERAGTTNRRLLWHLSYLHNFDASRGGAFPRYNLVGRFSANGSQEVTRNPSYRHLVSTGLSIDQDNFSLSSDVMFAAGEDKAWGLTLSPTYWVIPGSLKLVARYHYAESQDAGGLISTMGVNNDPLFDNSPFFVGDEYESFYIGANLHLYENQMVLMSGVEQIEFKDDAGAGFNTDASVWHFGAQMSF